MSPDPSKDDKALYTYYPLARRLLFGPAACDDNSAIKDVTIGLHNNYLTHRLDFESYQELDLTKVDVQSPLLRADKTFIHQLIEDEKSWLYKDEQTTWRYPFFDMNDAFCPEHSNFPCYRTQKDSLYFLMTLEHRKAFPLAGAVWNIRTDKNLVDVSSHAEHSQEGSTDAKHNGIASTGIADILSRIVYSQKEWAIQLPTAAPVLGAPLVTPPSVVPTPGPQPR